MWRVRLWAQDPSGACVITDKKKCWSARILEPESCTNSSINFGSGYFITPYYEFMWNNGFNGWKAFQLKILLELTYDSNGSFFLGLDVPLQSFAIIQAMIIFILTDLWCRLCLFATTARLLNTWKRILWS